MPKGPVKTRGRQHDDKPEWWIDWNARQLVSDRDLPKTCFYQDNELCCIVQVPSDSAHYGDLYSCPLHEPALQEWVCEFTEIDKTDHDDSEPECGASEQDVLDAFEEGEN